MEVLQRSWPWFVILGVIAVIGGILALIHPGFASLVVVVWAAWAFIVLGVGQLVHATVIRAWGGFLMTALMGILALLLGASLLLNPLAGVVSLTALLGAMFLVYGIAKVVALHAIAQEIAGPIHCHVVLSGILCGTRPNSGAARQGARIFGFRDGDVVEMERTPAVGPSVRAI